MLRQIDAKHDCHDDKPITLLRERMFLMTNPDAPQSTAVAVASTGMRISSVRSPCGWQTRHSCGYAQVSMRAAAILKKHIAPWQATPGLQLTHAAIDNQFRADDEGRFR